VAFILHPCLLFTAIKKAGPTIEKELYCKYGFRQKTRSQMGRIIHLASVGQKKSPSVRAALLAKAEAEAGERNPKKSLVIL